MNRRVFLTGIISACAAPAIIRTPGLIMPIKPKLLGVSDLTQSALEEIMLAWYNVQIDRPKNLIVSVGHVRLAQRLLVAD